MEETIELYLQGKLSHLTPKQIVDKLKENPIINTENEQYRIFSKLLFAKNYTDEYFIDYEFVEKLLYLELPIRRIKNIKLNNDFTGLKSQSLYLSIFMSVPITSEFIKHYEIFENKELIFWHMLVRHSFDKWFEYSDLYEFDPMKFDEIIDPNYSPDTTDYISILEKSYYNNFDTDDEDDTLDIIDKYWIGYEKTNEIAYLDYNIINCFDTMTAEQRILWYNAFKTKYNFKNNVTGSWSLLLIDMVDTEVIDEIHKDIISNKRIGVSPIYIKKHLLHYPDDTAVMVILFILSQDGMKHIKYFLGSDLTQKELDDYVRQYINYFLN